MSRFGEERESGKKCIGLGDEVERWWEVKDKGEDTYCKEIEIDNGVAFGISLKSI